MAITFHQDYFRNSAGVKWQIIGKFDLDSSYPTGGYLIDPVQLGLSQIDSVVVNDASFGYEYNWDKVNSKLLVFESSGGGGGIFTGTPAILTGTNSAPTFIGTPAAPTGTNASSTLSASTAAAQVFTGDPLAGHVHAPVYQNDTGEFTAWRVYVGAIAAGPFTVGETVTGVSGGTGVVAAQGTNALGQNYLDLSAIGGVGLMIQFNEVITGGTSGASATTRSVVVGRVTPSQTVGALISATSSENGITPLDSDFGVIVCPPTVRLRADPNTATYITAENAFEMTVENSADGAILAAYNFYYIRPDVTSVSAGTPTGTNASSAVTGTADAQVWTGDPYTPVGTVTAPVLTMDPYTPAGTIAPAPGAGAPQTEVAGGTNLSTVINVEFISFGL